MRIQNQFASSSVFWRIFDPTDNAYVFGRGEGVVQPGTSIGPLLHPSGRFKLELKQTGLLGPFLSAPGPIYSSGDDYVLRADGSLVPANVVHPPPPPVRLIAHRVPGFDVARNGFPFANSFPMSAFPVQEIAGIRLTSSVFGLCGGMVYAARDYFEAGKPPPGTAAPPIGGPLFDYLWRRLIDSFNLPFGSGSPTHYLHLMSPALPDAGAPAFLTPASRAWVMVNEQWPRIRATIDANCLCPIALVTSKTTDPTKIFDNHQVLVFGYEVRGTDVTLLIYDPNRVAQEQTLRFSTANTNALVQVTYSALAPVLCFFATDYVFAAPPDVAAHNWDSGWRSVGRMVFSSPDLASMNEDHLAVFARGIEGALWWAERSGGTWGNWASQGGVITSDPSAVSWADGRLDVFARGTDNALWHIFRAGNWSNWESLGGVITSGPDCASWGPGRLDVFARGTDNALWHKWFDGGWSAWESLGGALTSDPAAVSWGPGRLDVFARGADNRLVHRFFDGRWSRWESLGGVLASGPDVASWGPGRLDVFVKGTDGQLYQMTFDNGWTGWRGLGGQISSDPSAVSTGRDRITVVARGLDMGLWIKEYS